MERYFGALLIAAILFLTKDFRPAPSVLAEQTDSPPSVESIQPVTTESRFSEKLEQLMKDEGKSVELFTYAGNDHNISASFNTAIKRSVDFFDKYVKSSTTSSESNET